MPSVDEFRSAIQSQFREAEAGCLRSIKINSGQLHRKLGATPAPRRRCHHVVRPCVTRRSRATRSSPGLRRVKEQRS